MISYFFLVYKGVKGGGVRRDSGVGAMMSMIRMIWRKIWLAMKRTKRTVLCSVVLLSYVVLPRDVP